MREGVGLRRPHALRAVVAAVAALAAMIAMVFAVGPASAQPTPNAITPNATQRGPDPTIQSIEATRGTFATAQQNVAPGNGFNGGVIYYPTDTSQGTWGALAIVPGYTALCANEEAWMGPWLASFGFVVICIETNSRTDFDTQRGQELLAALDWLTTSSPVKNEIDPTRLAVLGHSMGGGGMVYATEHRPSLRAAIGLAPYSPSENWSTDTVPTLVIGGQNDTVVTPSLLSSEYTTLAASTQKDFAQIAGADHVYYTHANNVEMKLIIPWLKVFLDSDTRYTQFLCPSLPDPSTISIYQSKCPYVPPGGNSGSPSPSTSASASASASPSSSPSASPSASASSSPPPPGACAATYQPGSSWPGGFQGQVTVTAGSAAINGWSVHWTLAGGQLITQVWNGTLTTSGSSVTVKNASYNGSLAAGASTTFGFLANGSPSTPTLTCTSP
ncbi:MAG TPA: cellulose binding domain-containing protein [Thermomicrobiales bacterium]|nr:cellulose binding domain-containing protein [Thermomicrobiales bacterium]